MKVVMLDVVSSEHGSIPGHQPGVNIWHVAQITGVHKDHATAGDGGWRGILQVAHLQLGMCDASTIHVTTELDYQAQNCQLATKHGCLNGYRHISTYTLRAVTGHESSCALMFVHTMCRRWVEVICKQALQRMYLK